MSLLCPLLPLLVLATPADPAPPRVLAAWAAGPFEARIAFEAPAAAGLPGALVGASIRFEEGPPAKGEPADGRHATLAVAAARLEDGGRTLVLTTDPHPRAGRYTLTLPGGLPVAYDLTGVEAVWDDGREGAAPAWSGWLPSCDPAGAREALAGVVALGKGLEWLERPGRLTLTTMVTLPTGPVTLRVASSAPMEVSLGGEEPAEGEAGENASALFRARSTGEPLLLVATVRTGPGRAGLSVRVTTGEAGGPALDRARTTLPWVPPTPPAPAPLANPPDLRGGDPARGAAVFAGAEGKCATCHKVRGQGGVVGPDLSDLVGRDRLTVYRDVAEPSARIHPDYVSYTVALKDGQVLVGTVRAEGADAVRVTDTAAKTTVVRRDSVEEFRPSATSVMPVGLVGALGEARARDLVAFLTAGPAPAAPAPAP